MELGNRLQILHEAICMNSSHQRLENIWSDFVLFFLPWTSKKVGKGKLWTKALLRFKGDLVSHPAFCRGVG